MLELFWWNYIFNANIQKSSSKSPPMQYSNIIQSKPLSIIAIIISLFLATIASHAYGDTFRIIDTLIAFIGTLLLEIIIFAIIHFMHNQKNGKALFSALLLFLLALWIHDKAIVIIFILFVTPPLIIWLTFLDHPHSFFFQSFFLFL